MNQISTATNRPSMMALWGQQDDPEKLRAMLAPVPIDDAQLEAVRRTIIGPLSAMSTFHLMLDADRREAVRFWIKALAEYPVQEIEEAFFAFTKSGKAYPNPQAIVDIILSRRKAAWADVKRMEAESAARDEQRKANVEPPSEASRKRVDAMVADFVRGKRMG